MARFAPGRATRSTAQSRRTCGEEGEHSSKRTQTLRARKCGMTLDDRLVWLSVLNSTTRHCRHPCFAGCSVKHVLATIQFKIHAVFSDRPPRRGKPEQRPLHPIGVLRAAPSATEPLLVKQEPPSANKKPPAVTEGQRNAKDSSPCVRASLSQHFTIPSRLEGGAAADPDDDSIVVEGHKALVPDGIYQAKYIGHDTAIMFGRAPKVFLKFEVVAGEYNGARLMRPYRARRLTSRPGPHGRFALSAGGDLYRTLAKLLDTRARPDRISFLPAASLVGRGSRLGYLVHPDSRTTGNP